MIDARGRWERVGPGRDQEEQRGVVERRDDWRWLELVVEVEEEEEEEVPVMA